MASWARFLAGDDDALPEGFETQAPADPDETDNTGCQHANMKTNGMSTWCEDCDLVDDA